MTYMTNDQWAVLKDYADFTTYLTKNGTPTAAKLTQLRTIAYGNIAMYLKGTPSAADIAGYLYGLEYRTVNLMLEDEKAQSMGSKIDYLPTDYLYARDRERLASMGTDAVNFGWST